MGLEITHDLWFCDDCTIWHCNAVASGIDSDERVKEVHDGEQRLVELYGPHISPNFDSETGDGIEEFSHAGCDNCCDGLAGRKYRFAVLSEEPSAPTPVQACECCGGRLGAQNPGTRCNMCTWTP